MIGRELFNELKNEGCKYTEEDIIFIAKDKSGKLIWLERGNIYSGLTHIILKHKNDFEEAFGIKEDEIALYLYNVITKGVIIGNQKSKILGGLDRIYEYDGFYFTFVGMGDNGYIVTSFPTKK